METEYTEYEVSYFYEDSDPWNPEFERYETKEAAIKRSISLGFNGISSTVVDVSNGNLIHETIMQRDL